MQGENDQTTQRGQIHLNKFLTQATIKVTDSGITSAGPQDVQFQGQDNYENEQYSGQYGQQQWGGEDESDDEEQSYMTGRDRFEQIVGGGRRYGQGLTKKTFNANHPFAFVVRHNPTKQMLLIGRVIDAGQKQTGQQGQQQMQEIYPSQQQYGQGQF